MKKKKVYTSLALVAASALALAACGDETKEDKKTDTKETKDIQVSTERTAQKDILYTELALTVYNSLLYSPSANLDTNTSFQSLGYDEEGGKPFGYLLLDSTIQLLNNVDDSQLNDSEKEIKQMIIQLKNAEKEILEITFDKYNFETGLVELSDDEKKAYDEKRTAYLNIYKDNVDLIQKAGVSYFGLQYEDSEEYTAHIDYLLKQYEDTENPYPLNESLADLYAKIQDKDKEGSLTELETFTKLVAEEEQTDMYKNNSVYKTYIDEHKKIFDLKASIEAEDFDKAFIDYATVGSLVSIQYGQRSTDNDAQYAYVMQEVIKMVEEGTFDTLFTQQATVTETETETTTEGTIDGTDTSTTDTEVEVEVEKATAETPTEGDTTAAGEKTDAEKTDGTDGKEEGSKE